MRTVLPRTQPHTHSLDETFYPFAFPILVGIIFWIWNMVIFIGLNLLGHPMLLVLLSSQSHIGSFCLLASCPYLILFYFSYPVLSLLPLSPFKSILTCMSICLFCFPYPILPLLPLLSNVLSFASLIRFCFFFHSYPFCLFWHSRPFACPRPILFYISRPLLPVLPVSIVPLIPFSSSFLNPNSHLPPSLTPKGLTGGNW